MIEPKIKKFLSSPNHYKMEYGRLTKKLNRTFGTDYSKEEVIHMVKKLGLKREYKKRGERIYNCVGIQDASVCVHCPYADCIADEHAMSDDIELRQAIYEVFGTEYKN